MVPYPCLRATHRQGCRFILTFPLAMFGVNIENEGEGCLDGVHCGGRDLPHFADESFVTDRPDLERINGRFFLQPVFRVRIQDDEKGVAFP